MGVQPTTLMAGLVAATKSTDTTGPTVTITSPAAGANRANGAQLTVTGTATDAGGGGVAGVEVSIDERRHLAPGDRHHHLVLLVRPAWRRRPEHPGPCRRRQRQHRRRATRAFTVTCPCSAFGATVPKVPAVDDNSAVELGLRFTPDIDGYVTGVRFYKGAGNGGSHTRAGLELDRDPARHGHLHQRVGHRVADGELRLTRAGHGRAELRRLLHRSAGPVQRGGERVQHGADRGRAVHGRRWLRRHTGRCLRQRRHLPDRVVRQRQLLRRRAVHHHRHLTAHGDRPVAAGRLDGVPTGTTAKATFSKPVTAAPCR